jgi:hypothetical protein
MVVTTTAATTAATSYSWYWYYYYCCSHCSLEPFLFRSGDSPRFPFMPLTMVMIVVVIIIVKLLLIVCYCLCPAADSSDAVKFGVTIGRWEIKGADCCTFSEEEADGGVRTTHLLTTRPIQPSAGMLEQWDVSFSSELVMFV